MNILAKLKHFSIDSMCNIEHLVNKYMLYVFF